MRSGTGTSSLLGMGVSHAICLPKIHLNYSCADRQNKRFSRIRAIQNFWEIRGHNSRLA